MALSVIRGKVSPAAEIISSDPAAPEITPRPITVVLLPVVVSVEGTSAKLMMMAVASPRLPHHQPSEKPESASPGETTQAVSRDRGVRVRVVWLDTGPHRLQGHASRQGQDMRRTRCFAHGGRERCIVGRSVYTSSKKKEKEKTRWDERRKKAGGSFVSFTPPPIGCPSGPTGMPMAAACEPR